jgi:hypothetical protein
LGITTLLMVDTPCWISSYFPLVSSRFWRQFGTYHQEIQGTWTINAVIVHLEFSSFR